MKVKALSRSPLEQSGALDGPGALPRRPRNADPQLHPLERAIEEKRAVNAAKLERLFAQPFLGALEDGHVEGAYALARSKMELSRLISASADGEVRIWNLSTRKHLAVIPNAHKSFIRGLSVSARDSDDEEKYFSCSDDKTVKVWSSGRLEQREETESLEPSNIYTSNSAVLDINTHWKDPIFATAGTEAVEIWDENRSDPISRLEWGASSVTRVRFNPVERDILASCGGDRSLALYDVRLQTPIRKLVLRMKPNAVSWNPMEAFNFTVANEDTNLYTFDMRKLQSATCVHSDHVMAVMDVDYSPTGLEFASASYDKTIRIYSRNAGRSREVYHTKRMQRVFSVEYSGDSRYLVSGSDDGDIRIWKSDASRPIVPQMPRERERLEYSNRLKERFSEVPEVRKIRRHRHLPKMVHNMRKEKDVMRKSRQRRERNERAHSAPGKVPFKPERKKHVVRELT